MSPTIRIDDEVFEALQKHAKPFVDTPNDVLRRILGLDDGKPRSRAASPDDVHRAIARIVREIVRNDSAFEIVYESKRWNHFVPRSWDMPQLLKGERYEGRILTFFFENNLRTLRLHLEIQPGNKATRMRIHQSLRGRRPFETRATLSPTFCRVYKMPILEPRDYAAHEQDIEWLENRIREKWEEFKATDFPEIDEAVRSVDFGD